MRFRVRRFEDLDSLPAAWSGLRRQLAAVGLFGDPAWFELLMRGVFDAADRWAVYTVEDAASGRPLLLTPLRHGRHDAAARGAWVIGSMSHPENYAEAGFAFDPALDRPEDAAAALFLQLRRGDPGLGGIRFDLIRLWPMTDHSELGDILKLALLQAGFRFQVYANSFNRYETTTGLRYDDYFARRSANLRYSARRRRRALEKTGGLALDLVRGGDGLERAIADYISVAGASWKAPSSMMSEDILMAIRLAATRGALRLGLLRLHGKAVAAQFWIVSAGIAHCARLAYDEAHKAAAPGVVLTDFMIAHLLDVDQVDAIDFGVGAEDYKRGWMKEDRYYFGLLAFNPDTWRGRWHALRHIGGQPVKRWLVAVRDTAAPPVKRRLKALLATLRR